MLAKQIKQKGYPIPDLSDITGLSIEEIERIFTESFSTICVFSRIMRSLS